MTITDCAACTRNLAGFPTGELQLQYNREWLRFCDLECLRAWADHKK